jgi:hypothetical protein
MLQKSAGLVGDGRPAYVSCLTGVCSMRIIRFLLWLALAGLAMMASAAHAAEEPPHTIIRAEGPIEIRSYAPMILAEVTVSGSMANAGNRGFRPLADFIFGNNRLPGAAGGTEIAMTTPVLQARSEKIAMTAPVTQELDETGSWRVAFIMPAGRSLSAMPVPNDPRVTLREVPARQVAVIRFSGGADEARFQRKAAELAAFLAREGYAAAAAPVYARYDPPWVVTFLRRNEVMIEIAAS